MRLTFNEKMTGCNNITHCTMIQARMHFVLSSVPREPITSALRLVDQYHSEEENRRRGRPRRTPEQLMCHLLRLALLRFPAREFAFVGDAGHGTHDVTRFARRHRRPAHVGQQAVPRRQPARAAVPLPGPRPAPGRAPRPAEASPGGRQTPLHRAVRRRRAAGADDRRHLARIQSGQRPVPVR